jgi:hypothetical protein
VKYYQKVPYKLLKMGASPLVFRHTLQDGISVFFKMEARNAYVALSSFLPRLHDSMSV